MAAMQQSYTWISWEGEACSARRSLTTGVSPGFTVQSSPVLFQESNGTNNEKPLFSGTGVLISITLVNVINIQTNTYETTFHMFVV